ncbi:phage protein [Streptococcus pneumoniae]|nr:phage protein [Streptococcus pneumoniae]VMH09815.1 phage protein [Streptococcus pneumoniae]VMM43557.1 phage protein [Streptococcus pneumoniae]VNJ67138.1 phage protein [Streptococcus pneumoniae]VRI17335.1 phage protein [Streptococcus pneumoniae]
MQELQVKVTQAQVEIIDREKFEQNINEVVAKYQNYTVTAATIKDDKQTLADLRKLDKQVSDERIRNKKVLSEPADEFDKYVKNAIQPLKDIITKIAGDVKEFEEHQKAVRIDTVKGYLVNKSAEYMLDPRLFDEKALEYVKASDFMADGVTLKKATMKSLDDMVTFEFQKQQEFEKAKSAISGLCAEYGMTDSPYIRQLKDLTLAEVFEQIKADYEFEKQKEEIRKAQERAERESQELLAAQQTKQQEQAPKSTETPNFDPETGKILDGGQILQNEPNALRGAENDLKRYALKMTLEVYFVDTAEKDRFKAGLSQLGFDFKKNYQVSGYQRIEPLTQAELNEQCGW